MSMRCGKARCSCSTRIRRCSSARRWRRPCVSSRAPCAAATRRRRTTRATRAPTTRGCPSTTARPAPSASTRACCCASWLRSRRRWLRAGRGSSSFPRLFSSATSRQMGPPRTGHTWTARRTKRTIGASSPSCSTSISIGTRAGAAGSCGCTHIRAPHALRCHWRRARMSWSSRAPDGSSSSNRRTSCTRFSRASTRGGWH
mmetsp:Transcript_56567/g.129938  ORF Transcript_56567/g.129938 Transcript_56567/m.129938 type:complete len:201 (+) Transcript_56567:613-1215(+)